MPNMLTKVFEGQQVRVLEEDLTIFFVASDVAKALGYDTTSNALRQVDDDDQGEVVIPTPGGQQKVVVVSESGVYAMIFASRRPEAKAFKKWVTSKVLPEIRRTGRYEFKPEDFPMSLDPAADAEDNNFLASLATTPTVEEESLEAKRARIAEQYRKLRSGAS